jgi:hypothetical protein
VTTVALQTTTVATLPADGKDYGLITVSGVQYFPTMIVDGANPSYVATVGSAGSLQVRERRGSKTFTTAAPTTSAASVLAANSSRVVAIVQNVGSVDVYVGKDGTVTTSNGLLLSAGSTLVDDASTDAWYGITGSGTAALRIVEVA